MTSYRLGLDVGTNSLGWSVLELDKDKTPCRIKAAGVRIFTDGREDKSKATLKATRRKYRSARRLRDRFKQRRRFLISELQKAGLFPTDKEAMQSLQSLNPLALRAKALTQELPPYQTGRALFHLNQRRGFKSNRKDRSEETRSGKVSNSVRLLLQEMGLLEAPLSTEEYKALSKQDKKKARQKEAEDRKSALHKLAENKTLTYGSFLWERQQQGKTTRARPTGDKKTDLYDVYPQRELYEDEFNKIWEAQAQYHPQMTDEIRGRIHSVIFHQRPLKPQEVGKCAYLPNENRTFRALPSFQRYRIYQDINNLEWSSSSGKCRLLDYRDARDAVFELLEKVQTKSGQVVWSKIKNILKKMGFAEHEATFNFESPKRKGLEGNLTSRLMQDEDCVGPQWYDWPLQKQDEFIEVILNGTPEQRQRYAAEENAKHDGAKDDDEVRKHLIKHFELSETAAENCMQAPLLEGTASLSLKAARLLMDKMKDDSLIQPDAVEKVAKEREAFKNPFTRAREGELLPYLPYYGEAFQGRHIIPGTGDPADAHDDLEFFGGVTNPTVHIALNQIRQVVNELIDRFGHPYSIAIEPGRNLPAGQEARSEINKEQRKNQAENERLAERLREHGQSDNRDNRLRLRLWEELDKKDINGRKWAGRKKFGGYRK